MAADSAEQYLVEQIRAGQADGWQRLIERYHGRLLAFVRGRMASVADAEDLVQETFIGFLQSLPRYDERRSLETFLFTILRYKLTDYLRARGAGVRGLVTPAEDWWEEATPSGGESPSRAAARMESNRQQYTLLAELLRRLIGELRDRQAFDDLQVIELLFFSGMRNNQAAELLELDEKQVAGVKFRAVQRLQKYLEDMLAAGQSGLEEIGGESTVSAVWRAERITCLKRSTLGQYLLRVLEEPWWSYTQFHLDVVGCPLCLANLVDLQAEESGVVHTPARERIFASSVGFLSRVAPS
ncbi:MAG: hypothetical protein HJJLKODD_00940 [Phycisphaerae bacterium]|nr:hypothetical protein [Phycisphaerae bacterium]